jgi:hypothetical protein
MRREGGMAVKSGFYWDLGQWEMVTVPKQGGALPGGPERRFLQVPVLALLLVGPLMGALYVFFLPFIGFAMVLQFIAQKGGAAVKAGVVGIAGMFSPAWRPGEAYLAKKDHKAGKGEEKAAPGQDALDKLQKDIDEKRDR